MSGGSGMYHGANYQARVAAFFATLALSENTNQLPSEVPQVAPPVRVGTEQGWAVDDLAVWLGGTSMVWIQAKATLDASGLPGVVDQLVRNALHGRDRVPGTPLQQDDRLLLVVGSATQWISTHLREFLLRLGRIGPSEPLIAAYQEEGPVQRACEEIIRLVRAALQAKGVASEEGDARRILTSVRVWPITEDELRRVTIGLLDQYVLENGNHAAAAFAVLTQHFSLAAQHRTITDLRELRAVLTDVQLTLRASRSFAGDVEKLIDQTTRFLDHRTDIAQLRTPEGCVHIDRRVTGDIVCALSKGNIAVVGGAGAGKSSVLIDVGARLKAAGERVVCIDASDPAMLDPRTALSLTHPFDTVLKNWDDPLKPAYLLIDGFDVTRIGVAFDAILRIVKNIGISGAHWRVAIASRDHDLMHAPDLREVFRNASSEEIPAELRDQERFGKLAHVLVGALDPAEISIVIQKSPSLGALFENAPIDLKKLLTNAFNLSIASALLLDGQGQPDLSGVHNRIDLLDLWWDRRILREPLALGRERQLRAVAEKMIEKRCLRVSTECLVDDAASTNLLSEAILQRVGRRSNELVFQHAIVFDYVVFRLMLDREGAIGDLLCADRDVFIFVLPSIRMRFVELWNDTRNFYREFRTLFATGDQRRTLLMVVASIVVECFKSSEDLIPLLDARDQESIAAVRCVVRSLIYLHEQGLKIIGDDAKPWSDVALAMAQRLPLHEQDTLLVLQQLLDVADATPKQLETISEAARICLAQELDREPYNHRLAAMAIKVFIRSYDANPNEAKPLLNRLLDLDRIRRVGHFEVESIAYNVNRLCNSAALEAIYDAIFSDISFPDEPITVGAPSTIFSMSINAQQTLFLARSSLGRHFSVLLAADPAAAARVLCLVIERKVTSKSQAHCIRAMLSNRNLDLLSDHSQIWDDSVYDREDWSVMGKAFENRLRAGLFASDEFFLSVLHEFIQHGRALYLWRILIRNAGLSENSAVIIAPLLMQRDLLISSELGEPICAYLHEGYPRLELDARAAIDAVILSIIDDETDESLGEYRIAKVREYAKSIPYHAIASPRLAGLVPSGEPSNDLPPLGNCAMVLSGFYGHGLTKRKLLVSESFTRLHASLELITIIDRVQETLDSIADTTIVRKPEIIAPIVREIDVLSSASEVAIRSRALDVIAALVRIGLEWEAFNRQERDEFLPLVLEAVHAEETNDESDL